MSRSAFRSFRSSFVSGQLHSDVVHLHRRPAGQLLRHTASTGTLLDDQLVRDQRRSCHRLGEPASATVLAFMSSENDTSVGAVMSGVTASASFAAPFGNRSHETLFMSRMKLELINANELLFKVTQRGVRLDRIQVILDQCKRETGRGAVWRGNTASQSHGARCARSIAKPELAGRPVSARQPFR